MWVHPGILCPTLSEVQCALCCHTAGGRGVFLCIFAFQICNKGYNPGNEVLHETSTGTGTASRGRDANCL